MRILHLSAVRRDQNVAIPNLFDNAQVILQIAPVDPSSHRLRVASLEIDIVVFHDPDLLFERHAHNVKLRMCDDNAIDPQTFCRLDHDKNLGRRQMPRTEHGAIILDYPQDLHQGVHDSALGGAFDPATFSVLRKLIHGMCGRQPDDRFWTSGQRS